MASSGSAGSDECAGHFRFGLRSAPRDGVSADSRGELSTLIGDGTEGPPCIVARRLSAADNRLARAFALAAALLTYPGTVPPKLRAVV